MPRTRKFDVDAATRAAAEVFWSCGYAGASTDSLLGAMGIGRQSLYSTFGSKRDLYLRCLRQYGEDTTVAHVARLTAPDDPVDGIREMLHGLVSDDDNLRARGCFAVAATAEFGRTDSDVARELGRPEQRLRARLLERVRQARRIGRIRTTLDDMDVVEYISGQMVAVQVAARGGAPAEQMHRSAEFAVLLLVNP
ncbi:MULTISPECIES: TetR/AcrR family transcriptional regulator [Nocardiaceae]|uniref:TetR/AcrR family transcriptional regulator n=1 Tax=Nocardiaceae TaxID=85025 RepID=UPI000522FED4|nr:MULTISPECIES: TetR/AcrR family transcriptional regulator [Rhodococcus]